MWARLPGVDPDTGKPTRAPRDARYRVRYRTPQGHSRTKTFDRKVDAERFLRCFDHTKDTGEFVDPMAGRVTFGDYTDAWLERKASTCKPSTLGMWRAHRNPHLRPRVAALELRAIMAALAAILREAAGSSRRRPLGRDADLDPLGHVALPRF